MKKVKRQWDRISEGKREQVIREIIMFFKEERDEVLGVIAAEGILDFFLENVSDAIYSKGLEDARETLKNRFIDLEMDLDMLGGNA